MSSIVLKLTTSDIFASRRTNRIQAYARFLTHDEDVTRLDDLCAEMMGPFHAYVLVMHYALHRELFRAKLKRNLSCFPLCRPSTRDGTAAKQEEGSAWDPMVLVCELAHLFLSAEPLALCCHD